MKTKLLTAAIAILLIVVAVMAVNIERHKTSYAKLEAEYAQYKENQAAAVLKETNDEAARWAVKFEQWEKENAKLQDDKNTLSVALDESKRLRQQDRNTIYRLSQDANKGTCEDARQALRVCTHLHTISSGAGETMERLAGIYAGYSDELEAELRLCRE